MRPESDFTAPTAECPDPSRWRAYDSDTAEVEVIVLISALITALQPEIVVETGTAFGYTAEAIGLALQRNGHGHLHTVEVDHNRCAVALARCEGLPVTVHERSSMEWMPPGPVDFALFDSLFELRRSEYERFLPWFSARCVVAFHDTGPQHPLRESLDGLPLTYLPTPRGLAIGRVTLVT